MMENPFKNIGNKAKDITKTVGLTAALATAPLNNTEAQNKNIPVDDPKKNINLNMGEKKNSHEPIFVTDPNDPRLKEYEDSLNLYKKSAKFLEGYSDIPIFNGFKGDFTSLEDPGNPDIDLLKQYADKYNLVFVYSKEPKDLQHGILTSGEIDNFNNFPNADNRLVYISKNILDKQNKPIKYRMIVGRYYPDKGGITVYFPEYKKPNEPVVYEKPKHGEAWEVAMNDSGTYGLYDKQGTLRKGGFKTREEAKDFYSKYYDENGNYRSDIYDDTGTLKVSQK